MQDVSPGHSTIEYRLSTFETDAAFRFFTISFSYAQLAYYKFILQRNEMSIGTKTLTNLSTYSNLGILLELCDLAKYPGCNKRTRQ